MNSDGTESGHSRTGTAAHQAPRTSGANGGGVVLGGRYRLGERLGQGGMSTVFQAQDQALGRAVAVKLFRSDVADQTELDRQRGEVRVLAGLNHPNLVMVYDAVTDTDSLEARTYLVMELIQGIDLHRARQRADLSNDDDGIGPDETADMGAGLADALAYIHERGIVHRDVKPANILLGDGTGPQRKGHAKLTDFGIARLVDSARMTATGQSLGTATYFSPEQAQGLSITRASDIYSLGLVLLECLTGKVEFPGPAIASAAARVQRDPQIPSWLGEGWAEVLTAMTRRDPGARADASAIAAALRSGPRAGALGAAYSLNPETEALPSTGQTETSRRGSERSAAAAAGGAAADPAAADSAESGPPTSQMPAVGAAGSGNSAGESTGQRDGADASAEAAPTGRAAAVGERTSAQREAPARHDGGRGTRRRGPSAGQWAIVVLVLAVVVIAAGILVYLSLDSGATPAPIDYPPVPGELGRHLENLQESVNP
ncbi:serine/threonine-protein kinase [Arthrobacter castelli]|uniref:serine/threonine-protein kinase n=1 Tax=Arthrobacter castelli TaxID=271431 RepID=UPI0004272C76|nr:serine/threonine-protein kinase [Arthrobacter castelli]